MCTLNSTLHTISGGLALDFPNGKAQAEACLPQFRRDCNLSTMCLYDRSGYGKPQSCPIG